MRFCLKCGKDVDPGTGKNWNPVSDTSRCCEAKIFRELPTPDSQKPIVEDPMKLIPDYAKVKTPGELDAMIQEDFDLSIRLLTRQIKAAVYSSFVPRNLSLDKDTIFDAELKAALELFANYWGTAIRGRIRDQVRYEIETEQLLRQNVNTEEGHY